jgi:hypothetical protein
MRRATFVTALRAFTNRRRFQPFAVELRTGFRLIVRHPEALVLRGDVAFFVRRNFTYRLFDASSVSQLCDLPFEEEPTPIEPVSD